MKTFLRSFCFLILPGLTHGAVSWQKILHQPAAWYGTTEARAVAASVLLYQTSEGGWPKNTDMTAPPSAEFLANQQADHRAPTIDNGSTTTQLVFLARVFTATKDGALLPAVLRGIDYLLEAQYENGGWPQFYPLLPGYYTHITFNDNAMVNVLELLRHVSLGRAPFEAMDDGRRDKATAAVNQGVECILRCQVRVGGELTVWCAQHDEVTLAPAAARKFEPVSLSGGESVEIVRFLMKLPDPTPEMRQAIEAAVDWFRRVGIEDIRVESVTDPALPKGLDRRVVAAPGAPTLWARFYEIGTNRPIFIGRDAVIHYSLAEIEAERRGGYRWYDDAPQKLLERDYPRWRKQWASTLD